MHSLAVLALRQKVGMASPLFDVRYQVQSRGKEEMAAFLHKAVEELGGGDE
ncbi:MAG: hypothetical protein KJ852_05265 [Gammaproteobacteria bacterium]|nr:hypothetical protein [Gammaproteobacteria bacterium]MBU0814130.1 hypothetical protein [Gammaproteobacteria bacterium]MBU1786350.1 hypothetical protein [Gammaproteobacteria bacterium]